MLFFANLNGRLSARFQITRVTELQAISSRFPGNFVATILTISHHKAFFLGGGGGGGGGSGLKQL